MLNMVETAGALAFVSELCLDAGANVVQIPVSDRHIRRRLALISRTSAPLSPPPSTPPPKPCPPTDSRRVGPGGSGCPTPASARSWSVGVSLHRMERGRDSSERVRQLFVG